MNISEIFASIQGEGRLTGVPSSFIRTSGCNLRCGWCDTPYSSWEPESCDMSLQAILDEVETHGLRHCVVTGGEPMLAKDLHPLTRALADMKQHVTIETAGTLAPKGIYCDLASISPKLRNASPGERASEAWRQRHENRRLNRGVLAQWIQDYDSQLKFVIQRERDVDEVVALLESLPIEVKPERVLLMPEARDRETLHARRDTVLAACHRHGFRYCHRLQIELFGNRRGT